MWVCLLKRDEGDIIILSKREMAEELNNFFSEVFTSEEDPIPHMANVHSLTDQKLTFVDISEDMVMEKCRELENGKAVGPNRIAAEFLKELADEVAEPLCMIYRKSMEDTDIPED